MHSTHTHTLRKDRKNTKIHSTFRKKNELSLVLGCSKVDMGGAELFLPKKHGACDQVSSMSPSRISPLAPHHESAPTTYSCCCSEQQVPRDFHLLLASSCLDIFETEK